MLAPPPMQRRSGSLRNFKSGGGQLGNTPPGFDDQIVALPPGMIPLDMRSTMPAAALRDFFPGPLPSRGGRGDGPRGPPQASSIHRRCRCKRTPMTCKQNRRLAADSGARLHSTRAQSFLWTIHESDRRPRRSRWRLRLPGSARRTHRARAPCSAWMRASADCATDSTEQHGRRRRRERFGPP